jgi:hypothetical protein
VLPSFPQATAWAVAVGLGVEALILAVMRSAALLVVAVLLSSAPERHPTAPVD